MATGAETLVNDIQAFFYYEPIEISSAFDPQLAMEDLVTAFHAKSATPLGRGSFGETWRLEPLEAGDAVRAVKIILDASYPQEYLTREVSGLALIDHANIVKLIEVVSVDLAVGSRSALIFEFIDGGDVSSRLSTDGAVVAPLDVFRFSCGLLSAVEALHAVEMIHRDIKPANVALRAGRWDQPVLLDLGLAKVLNQDSLTIYPQLVGTLPFMAPEQIRAEPARKASDLWAIGVLLHLLLSGSHPFFDGRIGSLSRNDALDRVLGGPRPLPVEVPLPLANVVTRLLSAEPHLRGSAGRALRDLNEYGGRP